MTRSRLLLTALLSLAASTVVAEDRYKVVRPVIIESGIAGQWMMQLGGPVRGQVVRRVEQGDALRTAQPRRVQRQLAVEPQAQMQQAAYHPERPAVNAIEPQFLPQTLAYETKYKPGTIVIDTNNRFLYLVTSNGQARRYGVGVGKPGFEWAGEHKITRKAEWPTWHPPKEMIEREAAKGHYLPVSMEGGEANPLGARAMYLGSTLYRIHGTNAPWTIGYAVSSGCIRMRNEDVVDLYERVKVGTRVIVL
jgi:lipoprotein-anchoring transpeptidase ErfK/SrfK